MFLKKKSLIIPLVIILTFVTFASSIFATTTGSGYYYGSNSASYADTYALSDNLAYVSYDYRVEDCTNFVSQALVAGGWAWGNFGSSRTSPYAWYYNNGGTSTTSDDVHSNTWSVAPNLYTFITLDSNPRRGSNATSPYPGTTSVPYPANMNIGDLLFYDWRNDGIIDHATIYVANGRDNESGYTGALVDQHSYKRYHTIWSLSFNNNRRNTTRIYPVHLNTSY